jgi:hypothetical protein
VEEPAFVVRLAVVEEAAAVDELLLCPARAAARFCLACLTASFADVGSSVASS